MRIDDRKGKKGCENMEESGMRKGMEERKNRDKGTVTT
jgi:hypothetical protein